MPPQPGERAGTNARRALHRRGADHALIGAGFFGGVSPTWLARTNAVGASLALRMALQADGDWLAAHGCTSPPKMNGAKIAAIAEVIAQRRVSREAWQGKAAML